MSRQAAKPTAGRGGVFPKLRRWIRFSVASWLWMILLVAVLLLWYRDHQQLARQLAMRDAPNRSAWSIDEILGRPNTVGYGDIRTAWASSSPDGQGEFVIVEFAKSVRAAAVEIHETYNAGAVVRIWAVGASGATELLWSGTDPLVGAPSGGVSRIILTKPRRTCRLKIEIDSTAHPGWNEIDAVALIDDRGGRQWASQAWASSSFGRNRQPPKWFWP
jgi:hypothetical protein